MDVKDIQALANLGVIPILIWMLVEARKINSDLRVQLKDINERLLTMVDHTSRLQGLNSAMVQLPKDVGQK